MRVHNCPAGSCAMLHLVSQVKGTVKLVFRALITGIIVIMDYLFFWVLDLIQRHGRIDYRQEDCLPNPIQLKTRVVVIIYSIYIGLWILMYFEAYGLRLRREICRFFYRKREKKRVLYMYNDMLKKRRGFLRQMRHRVWKQVKARRLSRPLGLLQSVVREFPEFCQCLARFGSVKPTCLICEDSRKPGFHDCETEGCEFTYCNDCWIDVKRKCYACQQRGDGDRETDSSTDEDSDVTDDDIFN